MLYYTMESCFVMQICSVTANLNLKIGYDSYSSLYPLANP